MSLTVTVAGVDITAGIRYPGDRTQSWSLTEAAELGTVGSSGFDMDDPGGAGNLVGLKQVSFQESASSASVYLFDGFLADRNIGRGPSLLTGADRQWSVNVVDLNTVLNERIITGTDGKRPAETDAARISWLLGSPYLNYVANHGLVDNTTTMAMFAQDYTGRFPIDVLKECADQSGKNFFVYRDATTGDISLAYFDPKSSNYTSAASISNVASEVNGTTVFYPSQADRMRRDPSRVYSGVFFEGNGFHIYRQNATNGSNFRFRDVRVSNPAVGRIATATQVADDYLARVGAEEDRMMTCRLENVPAASVNSIKHGMAVFTKLTHVPGYASGQYLRVVRRTVTTLGQGLYTLDLELANPILTGFSGPVTPPIPGNTPPYSPTGLTTTSSIIDTFGVLAPPTALSLRAVIPAAGFHTSPQPVTGTLAPGDYFVSIFVSMVNMVPDAINYPVAPHYGFHWAMSVGVPATLSPYSGSTGTYGATGIMGNTGAWYTTCHVPGPSSVGAGLSMDADGSVTYGLGAGSVITCFFDPV